jgi:hypothetical protein
MLTQDYLNTLFEYRDGALYRRISRGPQHAGTRAGTKTKKGYIRVRVDSVFYMEHRLVFFMFHGRWPEMTDHINGVRDDNRIENLRECTPAQNAHNAKGKGQRDLPKGIHFHKKRRKYVAYVDYKGTRKSVGEFNDLETATAALMAARIELHGEFTKH